MSSPRKKINPFSNLSRNWGVSLSNLDFFKLRYSFHFQELLNDRQSTLEGNLISRSCIVYLSNNSSSLLINTSITHHALAEVVGVHPGQRAHEQWEHVCTALWVKVVRGNQAASHANHAAESGGEGVGLCQCLHRCIGPVIQGGK